MTLRSRFMILSAFGVATAIAVALVSAYVIVRGQLRGEVDDALRERARTVLGEVMLRPAISGAPVEGAVQLAVPAPPFGGAPGTVQFLTAT